jgi:protein gp37
VRAHLKGKARDQAGKQAKVSGQTMSKAKLVEKQAPHLVANVRDGSMSLEEAYKIAKARKRQQTEKAPTPSKTYVHLEMWNTKTGSIKHVSYPLPNSAPKFNRTNQQVDWAAWTWNPVTGCLHGCNYCYARELSHRPSYAEIYPVKFEPIFHHYRLDAPKNTEVPREARTDGRQRRVFVCSMADLYGKWVPDHWIERVHASCIANPQWDYLFLTKFPRRYVGLDLPTTAWLGTTVDEQKRVRLAEEAFSQIKNVRVKWLSLEPLLAPLEFSDLSMFDWVVIGSQSATEQPHGHVPGFAPPFEWVARITDLAKECGCRIYHKPNLLGITNPQSPGMKLIQETPKGAMTNGRDTQGEFILAEASQ